MHSKSVKGSIVAGLLFSITACGGGSEPAADNNTSSSADNTNNNSSTTKIEHQVRVIDGYIRNAIAYVDLNNNGTFDTTEPNALSGEGGVATLDLTGLDLELSTLVVSVSVPEGAVDESTISDSSPTGMPITAENTFVLATLPGEQNATPYTSIIMALAAETGDLVESQTHVETTLGLTGTELKSDYIASGDEVLSVLAELIVSAQVIEPTNLGQVSKFDAEVSLQLTNQLKEQVEDSIDANTFQQNKQKITTSARVLTESVQTFINENKTTLSSLTSDQLSALVDIFQLSTQRTIEQATSDNELSNLAEKAIALNAITASAILSQLEQDLNIESGIERAAVVINLINDVIDGVLASNGELDTDQTLALTQLVLDLTLTELQTSSDSEVTFEAAIEALSESLVTIINSVMVQINKGFAVNDLDGDGILNSEDEDIDGDGVPNEDDAFVYDSTESKDIDQDGIGDNKDKLIAVNVTNVEEHRARILGQTEVTFADENNVYAVQSNGLFIFNNASELGTNPDYNHVLKAEFEALNIVKTFYIQKLSSGDFIVAGIRKEDTADRRSPVPFFVSITKNDDDYTIKQVNTDIQISDNSDTSSRGFIPHTFVLSSNEEMLYAVIHNFQQVYVVGYQLHSSHEMTYVNRVDVSYSGLVDYYKNLALDYSGNFIYYTTSVGYDYRSGAISAIKVDPSTGFLSLSNHQDVTEEDIGSTVIEAFGMGKMLFATSNGINVMTINEESGQLTPSQTIANEVPSSPLSLSINSKGDRAVLQEFGPLEGTTKIKSFSVDQSGDLVLAGNNTTIDYLSPMTWADDETSIGIQVFSGQRVKYNHQSHTVNESPIGLPYLSSTTNLNTSENGYWMLNLSITAYINTSGQTPEITSLRTIFDVEEHFELTFRMGDLNSLGQAILPNETFEDSRVSLITYDETSKRLSQTLLKSEPRLATTFYQAWVLKNDLVVLLYRSYENSQPQYLLGVFDIQDGSLELQSEVDITYFTGLYGQKLISKTDDSFSIGWREFTLIDGQLYELFETTDKRWTLYEGEFHIEIADTEQYQVFKNMADTSELVLTSSVEAVKSIFKVDEEHFVTHELVSADESKVKLNKLNSDGSLELVSEVTAKGKSNEQVLERAPNGQTFWIIDTEIEQKVIKFDIPKL